MIPGSANPLLLASAAGGYNISRSIRLNAPDSAYLSRTPASAGNRKTWTWAGWVKRSGLGGNRMLMSCQGNSDSTTAQFWFNSDNFMFGVETANLYTSAAVFRDASAWYHVVFVFDSTNATAADRMILYINNTRQTASTYTAPTLNADYGINRTVEHNIGRRFNNADFYFDGYLADIHFIDGQALTPSSFGEFDDNGIWQPKAYTGSYGTNGFRLAFSDNSTAAALGTDTSGNGNTWTVNNISAATSGTNYTNTGIWSWSLGASSNVTSRELLFDGNINSGSPTAPPGNPGTVRYTWPTALTGYTKVRIYCNTHDDPYQYRRVVYNGAGGSYTISTGGNTTAWYDITSNLSGTFNWVEWGSYGGSDGGRTPSGLLAIEIDDVLLVDFNISDNDSLVDVPTNGSEVDTGSGGQVKGNYCTLNPLVTGQSSLSLSNGNLDWSMTQGTALATIGISAGKYYWEVTANASNLAVGIALASVDKSIYIGYDGKAWGYYSTDGSKYNNYPVNGTVPYGASWTTGDIIGIAFDADNGTLAFYKNGVSQGQAFSGLTSGPYFPAVGNSSSAGFCNFGQRPFAYTAPSGFKALCTANLPVVVTKPSDLFDVALYTGNNTARTITLPGDLSPDFVWIKSRSDGSWHILTDSVRGVNSQLYSNDTSSQGTQTDRITSFNSNGFSLGTNGSGGVNSNGTSYAAWCWDAGNTTVTNTQGSITSQVRANPSAGFSVLTYSGANGGTVGHGLGVAPSLVIVKCRSNADAWVTYHKDLGPTNTLQLQSTNAVQTSDTTAFNSTAPSSTLVTFGNSGRTCESGRTYVAYCFAPVVGYSSFGSFSGGSNPNFVYLGFRPRYVIIKRTDTTNYWIIQDSARNPYNQVDLKLAANASVAENDVSTLGDATQNQLDFVSNGFVCRSTNAGTNTSGGTYIYFAWAESPFAANNRAR